MSCVWFFAMNVSLAIKHSRSDRSLYRYVFYTDRSRTDEAINAADPCGCVGRYTADVVTVSVCSSIWISIIGGKSHWRARIHPCPTHGGFVSLLMCAADVNFQQTAEIMRTNLYAFRAILLNKTRTQCVYAMLTRCAGFWRGISLCPRRHRHRHCPVVCFQNNRITGAAFDRLKVFADICRMAHIQY